VEIGSPIKHGHTLESRVSGGLYSKSHIHGYAVKLSVHN
jgi:hypothetical protein